MAALPHARCAGRRRRQLHQLYGTVSVRPAGRWAFSLLVYWVRSTCFSGAAPRRSACAWTARPDLLWTPRREFKCVLLDLEKRQATTIPDDIRATGGQLISADSGSGPV